MYSDPGIVPRQTKHKDRIDPTTRQVRLESPPRYQEIISNSILVRAKYCSSCHIYRPPRSAHCSVCDNSVIVLFQKLSAVLRVHRFVSCFNNIFRKYSHLDSSITIVYRTSFNLDFFSDDPKKIGNSTKHVDYAFSRHPETLIRFLLNF